MLFHPLLPLAWRKERRMGDIAMTIATNITRSSKTRWGEKGKKRREEKRKNRPTSPLTPLPPYSIFYGQRLEKEERD